MTSTERSMSETHTRPSGQRGGKLLVALACLVGVVAVATPTLAAGGHRDSIKETTELQRTLDEVVAAGAPGAVALVRDGTRTIRLSSGEGNLEPSSPMQVGDLSRIGGVTKSFTATVVLQLVGEGKVALDDTVEQLLPGVIPNGDDITVRQLLNHTSGIYDYAQDPAVLAPYSEGDLTHVFDPQQGVQVAADHEPMFAPGTALGYSNTNYLLLGMIVEGATGQSIGAELQARIFEPLGLRHTSYPTSSEMPGSYTHGYLLVEGPPLVDVTQFSPTVLGASGAILSNATDVARFYRALLSGRLLRPDLLEAMQSIDPVATGGIPDAGILGGGWGLGLLREELPCGEAWGHDSENPGYMTAAWNSKDGGRQIVVVVNRAFDHDDPVSEAMRKVLVTGYCDI
jgi:D-alanyl-D-alanine carboxypeptidase